MQSQAQFPESLNGRPYLETILKAAGKLEKMGCRAILAECGYFADFQKEIAARMEVPVFMSSLLQVPWAQSLIGPGRVVGILMSVKEMLLDRHLTDVGGTLMDFAYSITVHRDYYGHV
jgi:hypothetical protein